MKTRVAELISGWCLVGLLAVGASTVSAQEQPGVLPEGTTQPDGPGEFSMEDLVIGAGEELAPGCWPTVHYKGWLVDGRVFVDSYVPGFPTFQFFYSEILREGWIEGLRGMRVGGKRRVYMPTLLAYRDMPPPNTIIQPGDDVIFEFEVLAVENFPNVTLLDGSQIRQLRAGEGEPARYGDWIGFRIRVFSGVEMKPGFDNDTAGIDHFQVALPTPPGIFNGNPQGMFLNLPSLDMMLYGMRKGERRDISFPSSKIMGRMGGPKLGVGINKPFAIEFECTEVIKGPVYTLDNGIQMQDLVVGDGPYAHMSTIVHLRAEGSLPDGTVIESNWDSGKVLITRLYSTQIIGALRMGIQGMRVGGERIINAPPEHAFGDIPSDKYAHVPPGSDVIYRVKVIDAIIP